MTKYVIIIIIISGALFYGVLKIMRDYRAKLKAGKIVSEMFAVWAEMGPYNTGDESGLALSCAYKVVKPTDFGKYSKEHDFKKHAEAYDKNPKTWEDLRQKHLTEPKISEFEDQLATAKGMAAMHTLIDGVFKEAGFPSRFEIEDIEYFTSDKKKIKGDAVNNEPNNPDELLIKTIKYNIGNKLLENKSFASDFLVSIIKKVYKNENNSDIEYIYELGETYLHMYYLCETNAYDKEFLKAFYRLNVFEKSTCQPRLTINLTEELIGARKE